MFKRIFGFFLLVPGFSRAQAITIAAAADLVLVFQDVTTRFQKDTGHEVKVIDGSSGDFFAPDSERRTL